MTSELSADRAPIRTRLARGDWQTMLQVLLHGVGFLASTLLITWGLFFLFFLMLGGFSFDGFIHQLNNLTSRYVAAGPARTGPFLNMVAFAHIILSTAIIILRRDRILPARAEKGERHG